MLDDRLLGLERLDLGSDVLGERVQRPEVCVGVLAKRGDWESGSSLRSSSATCSVTFVACARALSAGFTP